jgi:signal peptide peptidase-like protein 2B
MATSAAVFLVVLLFSLYKQSFGEPSLALLQVDSSVRKETFCAVYNKDWGSVPTGNRPSTWFPAEEASDLLACSHQSLSQVGAAVVSLRGNCSFCEKASYVESAGGSLLVVVYNESDLWVEPVCALRNHTPSIPVLLVSNATGWSILHSLSLFNLTLGPFVPPPATFDPSAIVTLIVAVVTVVLGSYIANSPFKFMRYGLLVREGESYGVAAQNQRKEKQGGAKVFVMTLLSILAFLALICLVLLLLYYFYYPMVYIVIAVYCVGAIVGVFSLLSPFFALLPIFRNCRVPENKLPLLEYRPDPRFPLALSLCVCLTVWWLVERHSDYGWVLQNILGFAFLVHIMKRMMFLPTWVVAVAMMFLFFYDIFMVFITPFITEV